MPITRECDYCHAPYTRPVAAIGKFCSPKCGYAARRKPVISTKYRMLYRPGHELAGASPYIPEHRALLWDQIGRGPHPCHRCGVPLNWTPGGHTRKGALIVDHLDRNSHNNAIENLAVSCQTCNNLNKDMAVRDDEDFLVRRGTRLRGERRSCAQCSGEFVTYPDPRPNHGQFCSRSCARRFERTRAQT